MLTITNVPSEARFIAFRTNTSNSGGWKYLYIDDLYLSTCGASNMHIASVESNRVTFDWQQSGEPNISIEYGSLGFVAGTGTTVQPTAPPYTITGLNNLTNYEFRFSAICDPNATGYCNTNYHDTVTLFTPAGGTVTFSPVDNSNSTWPSVPFSTSVP